MVLPRYIYRYKYLPDSVGIKGVVQAGTIKFTHPSDFNDPFDCMPSSRLGEFVDLQQINPSLHKAWSSHVGSPAQRLLGKERSRRILREKIENGDLLHLLLEHSSVLSLSKIPDSILMWSHYANFHRGAVVEFKIPINNRPISLTNSYKELIALDVIYSSDRPKLEFTGAQADGSETLRQIYLAKSEHWAYEQESRVIKRQGGAGIYEYNHSLLNSVIVGARSESFYDVKLYAEGASNLLNKKIEVFKAEFDIAKYAIKIPGFRAKADIPQLVI